MSSRTVRNKVAHHHPGKTGAQLFQMKHTPTDSGISEKVAFFHRLIERRKPQPRPIPTIKPKRQGNLRRSTLGILGVMEMLGNLLIDDGKVLVWQRAGP